MNSETTSPHGDDLMRQAAATAAGEQGTPGSPATPQDSAPDARSEQDELVAQLKADLEEVHQRALRAQAELENFRKRVYRQMDDERKYASVPLLRDLLPVLDNLQRAVTAAEQSENAGPLLEGVRLVIQQLNSVLQNYHCTAIDPQGTLFDPHLHEAIAQIPAEQPRGIVVDVTQIGYRLHDRVVRPAQVLVSAGPPNSTADAARREQSPNQQTQPS